MHTCGLSRGSEKEMSSCWVGPKCFPFVPATHPTTQSDRRQKEELPPCRRSQRLTNSGQAASGERSVSHSLMTQSWEHPAPLHPPPSWKASVRGQLPKVGRPHSGGSRLSLAKRTTPTHSPPKSGRFYSLPKQQQQTAILPFSSVR